MFKKILLNLFIEFGPIISFLIASEITTFIKATIIFVSFTVIALILSIVERKSIAYFPFMVAIIIITAGSLTIFLKNPFFLIIKDTLYTGIFALVLFIGLFFNKGLLKILFQDLFAMTDKGWYILSMRWAIFFVILTISNEIARHFLIPQDWVIFKGIATIITIVFSLYQFTLSKRERLPDSTKWGMKIKSN
jgi:intracellular septation protein